MRGGGRARFSVLLLSRFLKGGVGGRGGVGVVLSEGLKEGEEERKRGRDPSQPLREIGKVEVELNDERRKRKRVGMTRGGYSSSQTPS